MSKPRARMRGRELRNARARNIAKMARRRGHLQPEPCEVCGSANVQMHHDDYSKPREVRWLCQAHHRQLHDAQRAAMPKRPKKQPSGPGARRGLMRQITFGIHAALLQQVDELAAQTGKSRAATINKILAAAVRRKGGAGFPITFLLKCDS